MNQTNDILSYKEGKDGEQHGVLYCSKQCAINDGRTSQKGYKTRVLQAIEYTTEEYGALCPWCVMEYHSYL